MWREGWWLQYLIPTELFIINNKLLILKLHDLSGQEKQKIKWSLQTSIGVENLPITCN